jgi:diaminopimelate epimerase
MADVETIETHEKGLFMDTGSPHLVIFKEIISLDDVYKTGKEIRYSSNYAPKGTNVNFVTIKNDLIELATYERGVENVTLSCGTGTVASAIASNVIYQMPSPVKAITPGGELFVQFSRQADGPYREIYLIGPAIKVFEGTIEV